jgi:hypothetical protein
MRKTQEEKCNTKLRQTIDKNVNRKLTLFWFTMKVFVVSFLFMGKIHFTENNSFCVLEKICHYTMKREMFAVIYDVMIVMAMPD